MLSLVKSPKLLSASARFDFSLPLDLPIQRCLDEVDSSQSAIGDDSSVVSGLDTPSDLDGLRVTNGLAGGRRSEETAVKDKRMKRVNPEWNRHFDEYNKLRTNHQ